MNYLMCPTYKLIIRKCIKRLYLVVARTLYQNLPLVVSLFSTLSKPGLLSITSFGFCFGSWFSSWLFSPICYSRRKERLTMRMLALVTSVLKLWLTYSIISVLCSSGTFSLLVYTGLYSSSYKSVFTAFCHQIREQTKLLRTQISNK